VFAEELLHHEIGAEPSVGATAPNASSTCSPQPAPTSPSSRSSGTNAVEHDLAEVGGAVDE
jgi:hypothetical protein